MNGYRLHIDIPLGNNLDEAKLFVKDIIHYLSSMEKIEGVDYFQYKLSHDTDRGNKNYLDINENGHCSAKKIRGDWHKKMV